MIPRQRCVLVKKIAGAAEEEVVNVVNRSGGG